MLLPSINVAYAQQENIAIVVNQDAITTWDLNDRLSMVITSSGLPNTPDVRKNLTPQVVNSMIEEQIKMQEARNLGIRITEEDIQSGLRAIAEQNNMPPEDFLKMIESNGINIDTMKRQIRAQIAWTKVIQSELRPEIKISEKDINSAIARLEASLGQKEYLLSEIFLPVEKAEDENEIRKLANQLANDIRAQKVPFFKVAQQFSKAAGAFNGGDLSWVQESQLTKELVSPIKQLSKGQITYPIRASNGYHILLLRDQRVISEENIPDRDAVMNALGTQRLERLQQRHYLDLRATAFVENRV